MSGFSVAADDERENLIVGKANLGKAVRERISASSPPKLLAFGEIMEGGKYRLMSPDSSLEANFSSDVFVVINDLDGLLSELSDPESEYAKNWKLVVEKTGDNQLKLAALDRAELKIKLEKIVNELIVKASDAPTLNVLNVERGKADLALQEAEKKEAALTTQVETAKRFVKHGFKPLSLNFRLRIGGETFDKLHPTDVAELIDLEKSLFLLRFNLRDMNKDRDAWLRLLKSSPKTCMVGDVALTYVSESGKKSYIGVDSGFRLGIPLFRWEFWTSMGIIAGCLGLFIWKVPTSDVLRDTGITLKNLTQPAPNYWHQHKHPLSLARLQMSIWFFIIIGSFVFLWSTTGSLAGVNNTALILMGISGGTSMFAAIISEKREWDAKQREPENASNRVVMNWFIDILSSDEGMTIHRFQMFAWTLVLAVVFVNGVLSDYAMPLFSNELLGLMGISSGVYIGFKIKEGS
ncbi:MAG: hypothetical protein K9N47_12915 [Prosthecobacter sp.]|uniref:hypothetical protein n=1 Tax=Prosthecobacter sp. TaxID=1965333 RepID=UPI0025DBF4BA|nr:hypothetical protein [Prosthecobacter sp.]MCF7787019.1 hypothetical protein [Prosthecobacter sp.]